MLLEVRVNGNQRVLLSVKPNALAVSFDDEEVYSFDAEGRLLTAWLNEQTYVRTLDNRVIKKWREPNQPTPWKQIRLLSAEEKQSFLRQTETRMRRLAEHLRGRLPIQQAQEWLNQVAAWTVDRLEQERERFFSAYTPVGILPPDQYYAVVLQATQGCHWNQCTFCHFYREIRFRIKSGEEFERHIEAVKGFFGRAINLRQTIFLGDANALLIPQDRLLTLFDQINRAFVVAADDAGGIGSESRPRVRGIYSFLDAFTGERKSLADYQALHERHLRRVYIGVETGCDDLLRWLNKPATSQQVLDTVATLKQAGVSVGLIILIGVGGDRYYDQHVEQTVALLSQLSLDSQDIVYLSPLVETPGSEYSERAAQARIRSLTPDEQQQQLDALRCSLRRQLVGNPHVTLYDIREFVY